MYSRYPPDVLMVSPRYTEHGYRNCFFRVVASGDDETLVSCSRQESGYPVNAKHAELERRSAHQLRLKAVEILRSSTQLVKSHGDDLGLEYLWKGDEYGSLENRLKAVEKNAEYGGQPEILALVHVMRRPITVHYEDSDKGTVFGEFFTDRPSIDILYYLEERDDKGELIKAGHYVLLRRATLLSHPENEKAYSLVDYVAVRSDTDDWFMCVKSEINHPSKELSQVYEENWAVLLAK